MFLSLGSIKKPRKHFNLLHLETQEVHFLAIKVSLIPSKNSEEIRGKLHLCSRSLVFEPKSIKLPLMKMKYSNGLFLKVLKNFDSKNLAALLSIKWGYQLMQEDIEQLDLTQIAQSKNNELLDKLYCKQKRTTQTITTPQNCFFIKVDKLYVVNRNPISPYITETCDDNIVFSLSKTNSKQNLIHFLKLYQGINQAEDETNFINQVISNTLTEAISEHKHTGVKLEFVYKAKLIKPEGVIHGIFSIQRDEILLFIPLVNSPKGQEMQFLFTDIKYFLKYRYMFRQIGIEFWMYNKKRSLLFVFEDQNTQESVYRYFAKKASKHCLTAITKEKIVNEWVNGNLSNFDYLMALNTFGSRSFNDLSAYPVFPWIVAEYNEKEFAIHNPEFFRDLSKPIGALNKHRLQKYKVRIHFNQAYYKDQLKDLKQDPKPYLYPTHYSSPGTVVYYMIRKIPEFVIKLQNGVFGPTDRIFRGIDSTWYTTLNLHADSKELIPEFYGQDSDFLVNCDRLELGITQDGEIIDDAIVPAWADSIPDFLQKMRIALESPYVSTNLPKWIDLIFGNKASGNEALSSDNLFYPYTYAENVNWDKFKTDIERQAMEIQVTEFGQVPVQLFSQQHPARKLKIPLQLMDDEKKELKQLRSQQQQAHQDKEMVAQLQNQVSSLQWENDKLKFNMETFKQEILANKEVVQTFNSQFDQEEVNGYDFLNDDSLLDSSKKHNQ